jgi:hypothetical protein
VHPEREFVVGCNVGTRRWYIFDFNTPLRSMTWDYRWAGRGPHTARTAHYGPCGQWTDGYPQIENQVGFYGYYAQDNGYIGYTHAAQYRIGGLIEGYGRCVVGTRGFRAEKAIILAFDLEDLFGFEDDAYAMRAAPANPNDLIRVRDYLEKQYPTVPIFDSTEKMLAIIPMSGKADFTKYDGNKDL